MSAEKTPSVPAIERGMAVLEVVARSKSGLTFSQIARSLDFPKSSIHTLLLTFERQGYLARSETSGRYLCGTKLVTLANFAIESMALREKAAPLLRALSKQANLTVHLAMLDSGAASLIAKVERLGSQRVATWIGKKIAVHCTSLGKCLIAYQPETEVERLVSQHRLVRYNENTISSWNRLKQELKRVREQGWAVDDEEEEIGFRCIGAPVFNASGEAFAAISVSGNLDEIRLDNCEKIAAMVKRTADELGRQLRQNGGSSAAPTA
jgi:DNA-binding IclR family transcriptional regulator